jgi:hypothetical protein
MLPPEAETGGVMRRLVLRLVAVGAVAAGLLVDARVEAAPMAAPAALDGAVNQLTLAEPAQFIYLGRPYCWYPYGWAGPGWYWCGYGTRVGFGWGGGYGWNGWIAPRSYGAMRGDPGYRFRRYR